MHMNVTIRECDVPKLPPRILEYFQRNELRPEGTCCYTNDAVTDPLSYMEDLANAEVTYIGYYGGDSELNRAHIAYYRGIGEATLPLDVDEEVVISLRDLTNPGSLEILRKALEIYRSAFVYIRPGYSKHHIDRDLDVVRAMEKWADVDAIPSVMPIDDEAVCAAIVFMVTEMTPAEARGKVREIGQQALQSSIDCGTLIENCYLYGLEYLDDNGNARRCLEYAHEDDYASADGTGSHVFDVPGQKLLSIHYLARIYGTS